MSVDFHYKFYVFFYYKFILIKEFIKLNQVNYPYILIFIFLLVFLKTKKIIVDELCFSLLYTMVIK